MAKSPVLDAAYPALIFKAGTLHHGAFQFMPSSKMPANRLAILDTLLRLLFGKARLPMMKHS
jgi:hypothetical protein